MNDLKHIKQTQLTERRKTLKTDLGSPRQINHHPIIPQAVSSLKETSVDRQRFSVTQNFDKNAYMDRQKLGLEAYGANKPTTFVSTHPKRLTLGHNLQLDLVSDAKIVNNNPTLFYRS